MLRISRQLDVSYGLRHLIRACGPFQRPPSHISALFSRKEAVMGRRAEAGESELQLG